ncbi:hypothetical protein J5N97_030175 [Dioscorea zingiberensis]|uniref:ARM repeat superfamily protein n=1 Tax=Dioscorea zingiberensis TaxID=325984 RepID=A0A9D5BWL1_9LILI|nr:hypothetical protein J5N97_030175 [Dioscorea zingiberensis]
MQVDEQARVSRRTPLSYSPLQSPAGSRIYGAVGTSQRHNRQSPSSKKPPEPLRRAVADCLSASASHTHGTGPSAHSPDAARILRDYIATPSTTDMAYNALLEHALAERDRSPAVVPRCVAILKRYLLRYVPKVQTLRQIDNFCENSLVECASISSQRMPLWSKSLGHSSGTSSVLSSSFSSLMPNSNFASASLVKSINYVRSLVARHIPKLSFQPIALSGGSTAARQSLPSLSSLLSRSFTSQLSPVVINSSPERKGGSSPSASSVSLVEIVGVDSSKYIISDLLKWRWHGDREQLSSPLMRESDGVRWPQDTRPHGFLEVGAAALLVGDMEAKMKDQPWRYSGSQDLPDIDQLLQPSANTTATNFASAHIHLKVITASKRLKPGPQQIWANVPESTFRPRARPLFHYRHYSEQQPLRLNPSEISEVIAEVCSGSSSANFNPATVRSHLTSRSGQPSTDVAVSVLIKLVIDMYMMDSKTAAPLTLFMLEDMLSSPKVACRTRAFDVILNLGVHAHLLEPILSEDPPIIEEDEALQEPALSNTDWSSRLRNINSEPSMQQRTSSAIDDFESWLLVILFENLGFLVQVEEKEEIVWASALSCLFYFICDRGKILRSRLEGLDIRVVKTLLEISRENSWAEVVHCKLICMLTNMCYKVSDGTAKAVSETPTFLIEQVDLLGGIDFICLEYSQANSKEERRNLFLVLFDYVLHQINETCQTNGTSSYVYDEIQPVASMLTLADAPEAFYIAVKHGVERIGQIMQRSISFAFSRSPNCERQHVLLERITRKIDATISTYSRLDNEFSYMIRITKSYKSLSNIDDGLVDADTCAKVKLSWATLHSLLHSERSAYRQNAYVWLVELLLSEISTDGHGNIWSNIKKLQQHIIDAGSLDLTCLSIPLPVCMLCGLLKSKHNYIRWGFLFVLEKLLVRCKLLLDESERQLRGYEDSASHDSGGNRLDKANAVIDIMSCALSLVVHFNETDHINILKMCDMLFSQLCLRLHSSNKMPRGDLKRLGHLSGSAKKSFIDDLEPHVQFGQAQKNNVRRDELTGSGSTSVVTSQHTLISETSSMAAMLLRGHAIVPMQLVARVLPSLFYWPLIQLAGAATDDIGLGVAVGSKGMGNLPGATSDIRAALLLLLICKCTSDPAAFSEVEGEEFFRGLLEDPDSRVAYYSSAFLLKRMMTEESDKYQRMLQSLIYKAQQSNNEKLLENPYLQMRGILQLSNDLGARYSLLSHGVHAFMGGTSLNILPLLPIRSLSVASYVVRLNISQQLKQVMSVFLVVQIGLFLALKIGIHHG